MCFVYQVDQYYYFKAIDSNRQSVSGRFYLLFGRFEPLYEKLTQ